MLRTLKIQTVDPQSGKRSTVADGEKELILTLSSHTQLLVTPAPWGDGVTIAQMRQPARPVSTHVTPDEKLTVRFDRRSSREGDR